MGDDSRNITPEENWLASLKQKVQSFASDASEVIDRTMSSLTSPQLEMASAEKEVERAKSEGGLFSDSDKEKRKAAEISIAVINKELMNMDFSDPQSIDKLEDKLGNDEYWQFLQDNPKERERLAQHVTGGILDGIDNGTIGDEDIKKLREGRTGQLITQEGIDAIQAYKNGDLTREQAEAIGTTARAKLEATPQQVTDVEVEKDTEKGIVGSVDNVLDNRHDATRLVRQDLAKNVNLEKTTNEKVEKHEDVDKNSADLLAQVFANNNGQKVATDLNKAGIEDKGTQTEIASNTTPQSSELSQDTSRGSPT